MYVYKLQSPKHWNHEVQTTTTKLKNVSKEASWKKKDIEDNDGGKLTLVVGDRFDATTLYAWNLTMNHFVNHDSLANILNI